MVTVTDIITDEQITATFGNSDFGKTNKRDVIKYALLKYATGYHSGHTIKTILQELNLITSKCILTKDGSHYLFVAFYDGNSL